MNYYTVYSYKTYKQVSVLLATSYHDAWHKAEARGFDSGNYYIL